MTSGLLSRPTYAESFLSKTTCEIAHLLGTKCRTTAPTKPAAPTPINQPTNPTPAPDNQTQPVQPTYTPLPPLQSTEPLPEITPISKEVRSVSLAPHSPAAGDASVLGASTQKPLQSSPSGWKFFGIYWYWIVLLVGVVFAIGYLIRKAAKRMYENTNQKILKF